MEPKKAFLIGLSTLVASVALKAQIALAESLPSISPKETSTQGEIFKQSPITPLVLNRPDDPLPRSSDHFSHSSHSSHSSHYSSHR